MANLKTANGIMFNGIAANQATLNGVVVWTAADEFTFADAGVTFSINGSVVSLSITTGVIASSTYADGHDFGVSTNDIIRHNTIMVTVPVGYSNSGSTVMMELTATQFGVSLPSVTTTGESNVGTTFVTLNGNVNSPSGITEKGFYYAEGGRSSSFLINYGIKVVDSISGTGNYSEAVSSLENGTLHSYLAYATNAVGTGYGGVDTFTTNQLPAQADWSYTDSGDPSGGVESGSPNYGPWSEWGGSSSIQGGANPTSATCNPDDETCTITRTRTCRQLFVNADQDQVGVCVITQTGSGGATCSSPFGNVGDTTTRTVTGASYIEATIQTETRQVENDAYEALAFFMPANIMVTSCSVNAEGTSAFVGTNVGTATVTNLGTINPNNTGADRIVTLEYTVTGDIPDGYDMETETTFSFTGLTTTCVQPQIIVMDVQPSFDANSAFVNELGGGSGSAADGGFYLLSGFGGTYQVTAPTGTGGPVFTPKGSLGSGTFNISGGDANEHVFRITNTVGTVDYTFIVESTI